MLNFVNKLNEIKKLGSTFVEPDCPPLVFPKRQPL